MGRKACLDAQPRNWWRRWGMPREQRFRQERVLRVGPAPEPSDIKFENLEYSLVRELCVCGRECGDVETFSNNL